MPESAISRVNALASTANSGSGYSAAVGEYSAHIRDCKVCAADEDIAAPPPQCEWARRFFARCYPNDKHRYEGLVNDLLGYCVWDRPAAPPIQAETGDTRRASEGLLNLARAVDGPRQKRIEADAAVCQHV